MRTLSPWHDVRIAEGIPVWHDQLDAAERAALRPGIPDGLDRRPDVLVVGGGAQGLAAAAACRELGLGSVVVIERDHLAAGPSGSAAGALCPEAHLDAEGPAFVEFARASLARHEALAGASGGRLRLRWGDWLVLPPAAATSALAGWPGVRRLGPDDVRRLVPELGIETDGLLVPRCQALLNPRRLVLALAAAAGPVATGVEYLGLRRRGSRAEAVLTSIGEFQPGAVVVATGVAPADLLPLPQLRVKGHLAATEPAGFALPVVLSGLWGLEDGRLLFGGDRAPDDGTLAVDPGAIAAHRAQLDRLLPAARGLRLTHAWACARPALEDRLPVLDRAPGLDNVWLTAGHYTTGLLLAPASGQALARWIASGAPPADAALFRLDRGARD
ncbi:MAG TPA: FAD-dependent oxidoreductase [Candidatus Dormibacteraeota bacterium]|jgi:glycine/D-amino acid oxidase-like deaminating enzyme